jgi:hypothetical protein
MNKIIMDKARIEFYVKNLLLHIACNYHPYERLAVKRDSICLTRMILFGHVLDEQLRSVVYGARVMK